MASTDFRAVLNDVFKDSLDAAVLDYLSETLHGGSGLQEVLEPFLIDAGWANDGSVEATCADIERRLGCSRKDDPALTLVREAPHGPQLLSSSIVADLQKLQDADLQKAETCAAQELITEVTVLPEEDVTATGRASAKRGSRSGVNRRRAEDCAMTEQPDLAPWAVSMFSDWESELQRVAGALTPEDVTAMVRTMAELGGTKARVAALRKLAVVIEEGDIGGELLVAGGETVLAEKLSSVLKKSEAGASRIYCREVVQTVQQLDSLTSEDGYWQCLHMGSYEDYLMLSAFAGSSLEQALREALRPRCREALTYSLHECLDSDVASAHRAVQQTLGVAFQGPLFHVASVTCAAEPGRVRQNLVFFRDTSGWQLLCSVDFADHGQGAPSGHWHLNMTPSGDRVEHWGPRGTVYHGNWRRCPLWWLVIPAGCQYREIPVRLRHLALSCGL